MNWMGWSSIYSLLSSLWLFWSVRRGKEDVGIKQLPLNPSSCLLLLFTSQVLLWDSLGQSDTLNGSLQVNPVLVLSSMSFGQWNIQPPCLQSHRRYFIYHQPSLFTAAFLLEQGQRQGPAGVPGRCSTRKYDNSISCKVLLILPWPKGWKRSPYLSPQTLSIPFLSSDFCL